MLAGKKKAVVNLRKMASGYILKTDQCKEFRTNLLLATPSFPHNLGSSTLASFSRKITILIWLCMGEMRNLATIAIIANTASFCFSGEKHAVVLGQLHALAFVYRQGIEAPGCRSHRLQARFELPVGKRACYSDAYQAFLRAALYLHMLNTLEDRLLTLWRLEKKLLPLLHIDSIRSAAWFLDSYGQTPHAERRLLLSNYDIGLDLSAKSLQLGLNFSDAAPELFAGRKWERAPCMSWRQYVELASRTGNEVRAEIPLLRNAARWAGCLKS